MGYQFFVQTINKQGNYKTDWRMFQAPFGTSSGLHKERYCRIDVISELKCM